ncbi:hypothetical protein Hanom_Chr07g00608681 [Helianthus anomalus]
MTEGSKTYIPKKFYRTGGSKTYIPKNFYTKTTYITLLSEKFGGSGAPPRLFYTSPLGMRFFTEIPVPYRYHTGTVPIPYRTDYKRYRYR